MPWMLVFGKLGIEICVGVIGLTFLWQSYRMRQWHWRRDPFFKLCIVAWLWLSLVVTPLALHPEDSLSSAVSWIRFPLFFIACRYWLLQDGFSRRALALSLLLLITFLAVDVLWQYHTGTSLTGYPRTSADRLTGPFHMPKSGLIIGKLFLPCVMLMLFFWILPKRRYILVAPLVIALIGLLITGDISVTISTLLALNIALFCMMIKSPRWRLPGIALILGGVILGAVLLSTQPWLQVRFERAERVISDYKNSDYGLIAYKAVDIATEHPWHGVGLRNYRTLALELASGGNSVGRANHPHNFYLEWMVETGFPGLLLFVAMVGMLAREALLHLWRAKGAAAIFPAAALGCLAQHYFPILGMQSYFINWPSVLQWVPVATLFSLLPPPVSKPLQSSRP